MLIMFPLLIFLNVLKDFFFVFQQENDYNPYIITFILLLYLYVFEPDIKGFKIRAMDIYFNANSLW